mmetsp:Transcript_86680/g.220800  ORF Transcript_86680/g.220800 Transcript_86680/m.220800 type:complete len:215 (-) Transcript_86680:313-957(-)
MLARRHLHGAARLRGVVPRRAVQGVGQQHRRARAALEALGDDVRCNGRHHEQHQAGQRSEVALAKGILVIRRHLAAGHGLRGAADRRGDVAAGAVHQRRRPGDLPLHGLCDTVAGAVDGSGDLGHHLADRVGDLRLGGLLCRAGDVRHSLALGQSRVAHVRQGRRHIRGVGRSNVIRGMLQRVGGGIQGLGELGLGFRAVEGLFALLGGRLRGL